LITQTEETNTAAPLQGIRIVEFAGLGPGPFAGMMLADMGAEIIRIERPQRKLSATSDSDVYGMDFLARGRKSIALDLKDPEAVELTMQIIAGADGVIEGFRPKVMERLGLGPDVCHERNPKLVYGRMTGWGQDGPLSQAAGHDLNYIALTGALWATGEAARKPTFPMNLLGDFGGGGMYLAFGMVSALLKAQRTGRGDVVDAAICDGTSSLMAFIHSRRAMGVWSDERGANQLDGAAPWYDVYQCADGRWVSLAAIEPQFWSCLLELVGFDPITIGDRSDRSQWPAMRAQFVALFTSQTRDHWCDLLEGTDACFAPVLAPSEVAAHTHMAARGTLTTDGADQPLPAPRFTNADTPLPSKPPQPGQHSTEILQKVGVSNSEIDRLFANGVVHGPQNKQGESIQ
jgi:alpha-methylacyl-CoA racemase